MKLEGQYINLQILCTDLKTKKTEEDKESKESAETKDDEKYKDARMVSVEDLFGDKRAIKAESLFKPIQELFGNQVLKAKDTDEVPRLLLVQGRAGIGKTTFVRYVAHQWSKGQIYANYTWVFTLTLRKLRLLPNPDKPISLSEWIRLSQFGDWSQQEFDELWQRIELAINQNKVFLILDGYDETPESHPCQFTLKSLLTSGGRYPSLSLLITTRSCGTQGITEKRRNLEIIGFTDENINQYIQTYFLKVPHKALVDTLTKTLRKQPVIWANAHIPLNLNLLCGIMEKAVKKAQVADLNRGLLQLSSMTRLYQKMEKKLYERSYSRHDSDSLSEDRQIMIETNDFTKHYQEERLFLAKLAFQSFEAERIIISRKVIRTALQAYVDKEVTQGAPKNNQKIMLGETFFKTVRGLGLIKPVLDTSGLSETKQDYEFLHFTFQEYYTAIYLAEGFSSKEPTTQSLAQKIILKEKYNPRWQIVWWFVAGLLRENPPVYKSYLEQLQGQSNGQKLSQDIFEHYQLGLVTRCIDEGFESHNQLVIEFTLRQLQLNFFRYYQIAKESTYFRYIENLALIKSLFFSACRMSPNFCMHAKQDLYALVLASNQGREKNFLLAWIQTVRIVTPKVLLALVQLLADEDREIRSSAANAIGHLGTIAATPPILDALTKLLADRESYVRSAAAEAIGQIAAIAATPQILGVLAKLLADKESHVRRSALRAIAGLLGATTAIPQFLDALLRLLADGNNDLQLSALEMTGWFGIAVATPQFLDELSRLLADNNNNLRRSAVEAVDWLRVATSTPQFLDALLRLLADENYDLRRSALDAMDRLGVTAATPQFLHGLLKLLVNEGNEGVRTSALDAIGRLGIASATPPILDALAKLLTDKSWRGHNPAIGAVSRLGAAAVTPQILDALTKLLADKESYVRSSAAKAVAKLGAAAATPPILDVLLKLLGDENSDMRCSALDALGCLGSATVVTPPFLDALLRLLSDRSSNVRRSAAEILGKLGATTATPPILDALTKLLMSWDSDVKFSAAEAVGKLGAIAATPSILKALLNLLADEAISVRRSSVTEDAEARGMVVKDHSALDTMRLLGAAAATPQFLDALAKRLTDENREVRGSVPATVSCLGAAAATPQFLKALLRLLRNEDSDVRCFALDTVSCLGAAATPEILDVVLKLLADKDIHVRRSAAVKVGRLGMAIAAPRFLDALAKLLTNENWEVRHSAVEAVSELGVTAAVPQFLSMLLRLLADKDSNIRCSVVQTVAKLGAAAATQQILDVLPRLLVDENSRVRSSAACTVGKLGVPALTSQILDALARLLVDRHDSNVRCSAAEAVAKLGVAAITPQILDALARLPVKELEPIMLLVKDGSQFLDTLVKFLADKDWRVRESAAHMVGKLGAVAAVPEFLDALVKLLADKDSDIRHSALDAVGLFGAKLLADKWSYESNPATANFRLLPAFWLENADHPNMFNFVCDSLAAAYLNL